MRMLTLFWIWTWTPHILASWRSPRISPMDSKDLWLQRYREISWEIGEPRMPKSAVCTQEAQASQENRDHSSESGGPGALWNVNAWAHDESEWTPVPLYTSVRFRLSVDQVIHICLLNTIFFNLLFIVYSVHMYMMRVGGRGRRGGRVQVCARHSTSVELRGQLLSISLFSLHHMLRQDLSCYGHYATYSRLAGRKASGYYCSCF